MWFPRGRRFALVVASLGMAGCNMVATKGTVQLMDNPLASAHSDISFTVNATLRRNLACIESGSCPEASVDGDAARFHRQVQRISGALQHGAHRLYPDLEQRVPGLTGGQFTIYVVDNGEPGSASSANGRIVLNSAFAALQPEDAWLAFVIAREMGHVIARHHEENSMLSMIASVILNIVIPGSGLLKNILSAGGSHLAGKSRQDVQMLESDAIAFNLLDAAGFQLPDVARSLRTVPALHDQGSWTARFNKSSGNLLSEVRNGRLRVGVLNSSHAGGPML